MANKHEDEGGKPETPLSPQEVVRKFAGLHADRLLYRELLHHAQLEETGYRRMQETEVGLLELTLQTLPRILSGEFGGFSLESTLSGDRFYVVLPGGRLKVAMSTEKVEESFPSLREVLPHFNPNKP